ncbi:MAG: sugar phosphate nucleotidyltransferase [bacterium]|nr:sugar phosphate nucleotidyltransferase [bacterium]
MKALILGAGKGSRLHPLTLFTNKIMLPLHDRPILWHIFDKLQQLKITEAALIVRQEEKEWFEQKKELLLQNRPLQLQIIAEDAWATKGMAGAVYAGRNFVSQDNFVVIPGDNAFTGDLAKTIGNFKSGALVHRTQVNDPSRYGVGIFEGDEIVGIVEKPVNPPSNWALVSPYAFDGRACSIIEKLQPSARGEYEITDLCRTYLDNKELVCPKLDGQMFDIGTFDSLLAANNYFKQN